MSSDVPGQPDYLQEAEPSSRRKSPLVIGGVVAAVAVVGVAAWGVTQFLSDSTSPAQAVPASALAYLAVDLDPGKSQQLEAYQTLKKFPALQSEVGLDEDLRKTLFDAVKTDAGCDELDFAADVEPWLGESVALAVLPGDDEPVPFALLEVTDEGAAAEGFDVLEQCDDSSGDDSAGDDSSADGTSGVYGFTGDYAVVAETQEDVDAVIAGVEDGALADDATFTARVDDAGGVGFVTAYAAPAAADAIVEQIRSDAEGAAALGGTDDPPAQLAPSEAEMAEDVLADFDGAALSARFADESLEITAAGSGLLSEDFAGAFDGDAGVGDLPGTTVLAYGLPVGDDLVQQYLDFFDRFLDDGELEQGVEEFEQATGLSVPEDVQTLLGDGVAVAVDSSADWEGLTSGATPPTEIPAGIRIVGDPSTIRPVLDKALTAAMAPPDAVTVEEGDDALAIGLSSDYLSELAGSGDLGEDSGFTSVFPDLAPEDSVFYLSFEGDWLSSLITGTPFEESEKDKVVENVEPLGALGVAGSFDGEGGFRYSLRLTTD